MMRLPKFEYRVPREIAEAVKIMAGSGPEGQFVAGGTDLYPNMKRRQQTPRTVISVMRVPELNQISGDGRSGIRIGASVTLTDIVEHPLINRDYPVVAQAARSISTPILRNMGRSEEHTSELQSLTNLVCRLLLEKKKTNKKH